MTYNSLSIYIYIYSAGSSADNDIKRESNYINKSLTFLEQCVVALTNKNRTHVPYRSTKLTYVLKDSLGGMVTIHFSGTKRKS